MCHGGPGPWSHLCELGVVFLPKIRAAFRTEVLKTVTQFQKRVRGLGGCPSEDK